MNQLNEALSALSLLELEYCFHSSGFINKNKVNCKNMKIPKLLKKKAQTSKMGVVEGTNVFMGNMSCVLTEQRLCVNTPQNVPLTM